MGESTDKISGDWKLYDNLKFHTDFTCPIYLTQPESKDVEKTYEFLIKGLFDKYYTSKNIQIDQMFYMTSTLVFYRALFWVFDVLRSERNVIDIADCDLSDQLAGWTSIVNVYRTDMTQALQLVKEVEEVEEVEKSNCEEVKEAAAEKKEELLKEKLRELTTFKQTFVDEITNKPKNILTTFKENDKVEHNFKAFYSYLVAKYPILEHKSAFECTQKCMLPASVNFYYVDASTKVNSGDLFENISKIVGSENVTTSNFFDFSNYYIIQQDQAQFPSQKLV